MADKKNKVGKDITEGLEGISKEEWDKAVKRAEEKEDRQADWLADLAKKKADKKR